MHINFFHSTIHLGVKMWNNEPKIMSNHVQNITHIYIYIWCPFNNMLIMTSCVLWLTSGYLWRLDTIWPWYPWPSDTRGYVTPVIPNALFGRHNSKISQNNTRGSHPKTFISPQIKIILWLSAMVPINVVRVSEPTVCTFRLLIRVFTPLPEEGEKTQNPGSDFLNLGSRKFLKTCSSI
jgi:hypothetical protein